MWYVHDNEQPHPEGFDEHPEGTCIGAIYDDRFRPHDGVEDLTPEVMIEIALILLRLKQPS